MNSWYPEIVKNKTPVIIVAVVLLLALLAFVFTRSTQAPESAMTGTSQKTGSGAFTSIKDALSKSVSLQCNFTDEDGRQTETYIKNGAVRANYTAADPDESGSMIMKDKTFYMWNAKNEGWKMQIPESDESGTQAPGQEGQVSWDDTMKAIEKYKESCKPSVVADSLFTPPSTVKFADYSQMMNQYKQIRPTSGAGTGTGTGTGTQPGYNQEDIQKMMQQYQSEPSSGENN